MKKILFYQHFQPLYDALQEEVESLEFVRSVNFESIDALKDKDTKCLLIFDIFFEEICNSKTSVDIALAGKQRKSSSIYICIIKGN